MAIALPALPPLLTSPMETAPPSAEDVATPALPALAVSVCSKRSSNDCRDSADQLFRFLLRLLLLLLPLLLLRWLLLLRSRSLPESAARLPVPPLASLMLVPPSATTSSTVAFSTVPPVTATQRSLPPRWAASALETVTAPRFSATTAAVAIEKIRTLPMAHSPSLSRVGSVRSRRVASGSVVDRSIESPERLPTAVRRGGAGDAAGSLRSMTPVGAASFRSDEDMTQGSARVCLLEVGARATPRSSTGGRAPTVSRTNRSFTSILPDPAGREGCIFASLDAPAASGVRVVHRAGALHLANHPRGSPTGDCGWERGRERADPTPGRRLRGYCVGKERSAAARRGS